MGGGSKQWEVEIGEVDVYSLTRWRKPASRVRVSGTAAEKGRWGNDAEVGWAAQIMSRLRYVPRRLIHAVSYFF
jgi:hypothetical protein